MGTSTDAILFYGYCWTEETSHPWNVGRDDPDNRDEDWEERWARAKGLVAPTETYPETRDRHGKPLHDLPPDKAAIVAKYAAYWDAKRALTEPVGCVAETHCSGECPMPFVAVKASKIKAWRGYPKEIASLKIEPEWQAMLDEFCATLGIKTEGMKAAWWLVSDWN